MNVSVLVGVCVGVSMGVNGDEFSLAESTRLLGVGVGMCVCVSVCVGVDVRSGGSELGSWDFRFLTSEDILEIAKR